MPLLRPQLEQLRQLVRREEKTRQDNNGNTDVVLSVVGFTLTGFAAPGAPAATGTGTTAAPGTQQAAGTAPAAGGKERAERYREKSRAIWREIERSETREEKKDEKTIKAIVGYDDVILTFLTSFYSQTCRYDDSVCLDAEEQDVGSDHQPVGTRPRGRCEGIQYAGEKREQQWCKTVLIFFLLFF